MSEGIAGRASEGWEGGSGFPESAPASCRVNPSPLDGMAAFQDRANPVTRQLSRSYFVPSSLEAYEQQLRQVQCEGYLRRRSRTTDAWRRRWFLLKVLSVHSPLLDSWYQTASDFQYPVSRSRRLPWPFYAVSP